MVTVVLDVVKFGQLLSAVASLESVLKHTITLKLQPVHNFVEKNIRIKQTIVFNPI